MDGDSTTIQHSTKNLPIKYTKTPQANVEKALKKGLFLIVGTHIQTKTTQHYRCKKEPTVLKIDLYHAKNASAHAR